MSQLYIDRGFVSVNGQDIFDVESITVRASDGTKHVPTMSRNRRFTGVVKSNREITCSFSIAVQSKLGTPKLEALNYEDNNVALTFEHGGDRYSLTNMDFVDFEQSASGIGSEGKKNFNMIALDIIDQVGNSALFPTSISNAAN